MRAIIYLRMSKDHTGEALGVDRQRTDCIALCKARGWDIIDEISENSVSATYGDRPGFDELLRQMRIPGHVDVIVVWHVDRLLRKMTELEAIIEIVESTGVQVATATGDIDLTTDTGRMVGRILASVARAEIERKSIRQKRANLQKAQSGLPHVTHRPYGYEQDGLTIRPDEAEGLQLMAKLTLNGHSYQEVAYQLNERGYRTTKGELFFNRTVRKFLGYKRYIGIREYDGVEYEAQWPPILTREEFDQLQETMRTRKQSAPTRPTSRKYLLTGLLICGRCQRPLVGCRTKSHRDGTVRRIYNCQRQGSTQRHAGCGRLSRNADALDEFIRQLVCFRLDGSRLASFLSAGSSDDGRLQVLLDARKAKVGRKASLTDDYGDGTLTKTEYIQQKARVDSALDALDGEITDLQRGLKLQVKPGQLIEDAWANNTDQWRRALIEMLIDRVEVLPTQPGGVKKADYFAGFRFNPADVKVSWLV